MRCFENRSAENYFYVTSIRMLGPNASFSQNTRAANACKVVDKLIKRKKPTKVKP